MYIFVNFFQGMYLVSGNFRYSVFWILLSLLKTRRSGSCSQPHPGFGSKNPRSEHVPILPETQKKWDYLFVTSFFGTDFSGNAWFEWKDEKKTIVKRRKKNPSTSPCARFIIKSNFLWQRFYTFCHSSSVCVCTLWDRGSCVGD